MKLSDRDLRELAPFFAKRFSTDILLSLDADAEGSDASEAWYRSLVSARDDGRLTDLARRAAQLNSADANLQDVCATLRRRSPSRAIGATMALGSLAMLALLGIAGIAAVVWNGHHEVAVELASSSVLEEIPASEEELQLQSLVNTVSENGFDAEPSMVESPPEPEVVAAIPEVKKKRKRRRRTHSRPCSMGGTDLVGYYYFGADAPGTQGDLITIRRDVNVREDYPDHRNGYNKRAEVRCVLEEGDSVRLSMEPILVPGNHYWVPLIGSDLVDEA